TPGLLLKHHVMHPTRDTHFLPGRRQGVKRRVIILITKMLLRPTDKSVLGYGPGGEEPEPPSRPMAMIRWRDGKRPVHGAPHLHLRGCVHVYDICIIVILSVHGTKLRQHFIDRLFSWHADILLCCALTQAL